MSNALPLEPKDSLTSIIKVIFGTRPKEDSLPGFEVETLVMEIDVVAEWTGLRGVVELRERQLTYAGHLGNSHFN